MPRILISLLLLSLTACSETAPPAQASVKSEPKVQPMAQPAKADPNEELAIRVRRALEEAGKIDVPAIDIRAIDGVVALYGTTGTKDERERAGRIAGSVDGVKSVENKLVVVRGS